MGKGGKARRARRKQRAARLAAAAAAGVPSLAAVPRRHPGGRARQPVERDASVPAIEARCRHAGVEATPEAKREMRAPWNGCPAGRAMARAVTANDERWQLWDAIQHIRRVQHAHDVAIGAPRRHALVLRLLAPVDEMHADAASPAPDTRTPEERVRQASAALQAVNGWLGWTDTAAMAACKRAVIDDERPRDVVGLISALRCVSDGIRGERMVWRGRK